MEKLCWRLAQAPDRLRDLLLKVRKIPTFDSLIINSWMQECGISGEGCSICAYPRDVEVSFIFLFFFFITFFY